EGIARMVDAGAGLRELVAVEAILTSPLVRARQTAAILAEAFAGIEIRNTAALAGGNDDDLLAAVGQFPDGVVAGVGHEPHISRTLSNLLTGDPDRVYAPFKKGAAALVRFRGRPRAGEGELEWFMQPAALRAIGKT